MFFVFNKQKIISYIVAFSTVFVLFIGANIFMKDKSTVETATDIEKLLPIYSVQTYEKKVSLTINCAWS